MNSYPNILLYNYMILLFNSLLLIYYEFIIIYNNCINYVSINVYILKIKCKYTSYEYYLVFTLQHLLNT